MRNQGSDHLREKLRQLVRNLGILEKSDVACCGVTMAQCHAIVEIGRANKLSLVDLAALLELEKSSMSRTINNLVEAGIVNREVDNENRRYISIQLTQQGIEVFHSIEDNMHHYYTNIFQSIPDDKRDQVLESLEILVKSIKENN